MGNRSSTTTQGHRRIYVGDVPEIEETGDPDNPFQSVIDRTAEPRSSPSVDQHGRPTPGALTQRRNSIANKSQRVVPGKTARYCTNMIISSRYTIWTFIPKNLFAQFRRFVNIYFLGMCILQSIIPTAVSGITTAMPLIFVIVVTAVKQGYEDWLRHRADNLVNNRLVKIIRDGKLVSIKAKDVVVGDILKLESEEQVPADLMVVGSSDDFLRCQLTTANLDGETNLKMRYCPPGLPILKCEEDFQHLHIIIESENPGCDLYVFNGSVLIPADRMVKDSSEPSAVNLESDPKGKQGTGTENRRNSKGLPLYTESPRSPGSRTSQTSQGPVSNFFQTVVGMDNMALRGTKVKNTDFIYGVVVYTGRDTRLAMNSKITHTKFSTVEKSINKYILVFVIVLTLLVAGNTGLHFAYYRRDNLDPDPNKAWYLYPSTEVDWFYVFELIANFLILFNYIIPISLYVTLELQKFIGSKFFVWDLDMRCPTTQSPPLCNTSDLNEELGQIQYLFTDKTGTLTENIMEFRHCSINGIRYDMKEDNELYIVDDALKINDLIVPKNSADVSRFLIVLALCHTVQLQPHRRPSFDASAGFSFTKHKVTAKMKAASSLFTLGSEEEKAPLPGLGNMEYQASSPDEKALLEACYHLGVIYLGERDDILTVEVFGTSQTFRRHYTLEFDPNRKCMSVIVEETETGQFWLLSKGAENTILHRSDSGPIPGTMKHIIDFALMGMRTLAVAERKLTKAEVKNFSVQVNAARRLLKGREEKMRDLYRSLESNLHVLGATGVEDQLQDEVAETLQAFGAAGIQVWMLTGDKVETAVNVAISCGLVTPATKQLFATDHKSVDAVAARIKELANETTPGENTTVIIDGETLAIAMKACPEDFKRVALDAFRVVCCRMTPLQKAQMVHMVKTSPGRPITAAVGDGANDVAMIQEAHIGLAILGKEGRQAARCADFAVARFSFLRKAILVHGHWYYVRVSNLVLYFFYKNVVFILPQVFFCYAAVFSAQTLFNSYFLTMFNIFFAACPIFTYGLQEQPHCADKLMRNPSMYKKLSRNVSLGWLNFMWWNLLAIYHSIMAYYLSEYVAELNDDIGDWSSFGTVVYCGIVSVSNMKMFEFTRHYTFWTYFSHCYSYVTFFVFTSIYSEADLRIISIDPGAFRHTYYRVMSSVSFWLLMLLINVAALTPDFAGRAFLNGWGTIRKIYKRLSKAIPPVRLKKFRSKKFNMPQMSLLFSKRTGKIAISKTTLTSYLSRRDL